MAADFEEKYTWVLRSPDLGLVPLVRNRIYAYSLVLIVSQHDHNSVFIHPFIAQCHLFLLEITFFFHISCSTQSIISHKVALFLSDIEPGGKGSTKPALVHPSHVSRTQLSGLLCPGLHSSWPGILNTRVLYHSLVKIYLHFSFILSPHILFLFVLHLPKLLRCIFIS